MGNCIFAAAVAAVLAGGCSSQNDTGATGAVGPGAEWTLAVVSGDWSPRRYSASVVFDGKMWLVGGSFKGGNRTNSVWFSRSGRAWRQAVRQPAWQPRSSHAVVVHDGKMWLLGGYLSGSGHYKNDVWFSTDGATWVQATDSASWAPRRYHTAVSYRGRIWIFGGFSFGTELNDVWSSTDGVTWDRATEHAPWRSRAAHSALVHNDLMWIMGGSSPSEGDIVTMNDVWSSSDGVNWTLTVEAAAWEPRRSQTVLSYDGRIWLLAGRLGGRTDVFKNDVWSSADGASWSLETGSAAWAPRRGHTSVVFDDRLWIIGGADAGLFNDVWHSGSLAESTPHNGR